MSTSATSTTLTMRRPYSTSATFTTFTMRHLRALLLVILLITMSTFGPPNRAAAMPDETLRGEIWSDANCDGLRQETESLHTGMVVYLFSAGADGIIHTADDQLIEQSGSSGTMVYSLGVPDLDYALNVVPLARPLGYVPAPLNIGSDRTIDNDLSGNWSTAGFRFSESQTVSDIDIGLCVNSYSGTIYLPLIAK